MTIAPIPAPAPLDPGPAAARDRRTRAREETALARRTASWFWSPALRSDGNAVDAPYAPLLADHPVLSAIARVVGLVLALVAMAALLGTLVSLLGLSDEMLGPVGSVINIVGVSIAYLLVVLFLERRVPPFELVLRRLLGLLGGVALGAAFCAAIVGLLALYGAYRVTGTDPSYNVVPDLLTLGLGAGIVEELLFRGILYRWSEQLFGTWAATLISGAVFGLAHITNPQATLWGAIAIALEAGLLFAVLYALTRSMWLMIGFHAAWNLTQGSLFGINVSGSGRSHGFLVSQSGGPDWLSGGVFGMEASVLTVTILVAFAVWCAWQLHRRRLVVAPVWVRRRRQREITPAAPSAL